MLLEHELRKDELENDIKKVLAPLEQEIDKLREENKALNELIEKRKIDLEEVFQHLRKEGYTLPAVTNMYGEYLYREGERK